jgi:hypothetical protein
MGIHLELFCCRLIATSSASCIWKTKNLLKPIEGEKEISLVEPQKRPDGRPNRLIIHRCCCHNIWKKKLLLFSRLSFVLCSAIVYCRALKAVGQRSRFVFTLEISCGVPFCVHFLLYIYIYIYIDIYFDI